MMFEPQAPRRRSWGRRLRRSVLSFLVLAAFGAAADYMYCLHERQQLAAALAELDATDPGWRLEDIEAARAVVPEQENSAPLILAVYDQIPKKGLLTPEFFDVVNKTPDNVLPNPAEWSRFRDSMATAQQAVEQGRRLIDYPHGRFPLNVLPNAIETLLDHNDKVRLVGGLLAHDASRWAWDGDGDAALRSCRAAWNTANAVEDEPTLISQLCRIAIDMESSRTVERTLAVTTPSPAALTATQTLWESAEVAQPTRIGLRGERAMFHRAWDNIAKGKVSLDEQSGEIKRLNRGFLGWLFRRYRLSAEDAGYLADMTGLYRATDLSSEDRPQAFDDVVDQARQSGRALIHYLPAAGRVQEAENRWRARNRCILVLLAAERYRIEVGRLPDIIAALVPKYLSDPPTDPYNGEPLLFRREPDRFIVYSVGPDLSDDGGTFDRENPIAPGTDVGVTLWDVSKRRQPPPKEPPP